MPINLKGATGGFLVQPNPPVLGENMFTGADQTEAETARDAYFSANPDVLATYDNNVQKLILLVYGGAQYYNNRSASGTWVDSFNSTTSSIDISTHSVRELSDVTGAGRGSIITTAEAQQIADSTSRLSELTNVDNTSDTDKPVSDAQQTAIGAKEDSLGNPAEDGQVLTSTAAGTRSWTSQESTALKMLGAEYSDLNYSGYGTLAEGTYAVTDTGSNLSHMPFTPVGETTYLIIMHIYAGEGTNFGQRAQITSASDPVRVFTRSGTEYSDAVSRGWMESASSASVAASVGAKEDDLGNPTADGQILSSTISGTRTWIDPPSGGDGGGADVREDVDWILSTDMFAAPVIAYSRLDMEVNSIGTSEPYILGGTEPILEWEVTSGALPSAVSFDTSTGVLTYSTTSSTGEGSFGITARNPVGDSAEYIVEWTVSQANGVAQFTNSENPYPFLGISTSNSVNSQLLLKQPFYGRMTATSNGTLIEDPAWPIYAASNGDGTWNYMIYPTGYSYWMIYVNRTTDPATLVDGLSTDLGGGTYDLVCPVSDNVIKDGVNYPVDRSDVHMGGGLSYFNLGAPAELDGFMTDASSWSYGFTLGEDIDNDGLGRVMFAREGRNWLAYYFGQKSNYANMLYGNGSSRNYDREDIYPAGGLFAGDVFRVTFNGTTTTIYINGSAHFSYSTTSYWDGASANALDIHFGNGVESNLAQSSMDSYFHSNWQGMINRMWIANGTVVSADDDGVTYPTGTTHAWDLTEVEGSTFAPAIGSLSLTGVNE